MVLSALWSRTPASLTRRCKILSCALYSLSGSLLISSNSIFLYFFLLTSFGGIVYFFYVTWIAPYFPQKRRAGKGGEGAKKSGAAKRVDEQGSASGSDVPVTSATTYNAEWIPSHHINKPEARKVKGTGRSKSRA